MATKLETIYQEASLKDVFDFFVKNYKLPDGNSIVAHEVFFDVYKQKTPELGIWSLSDIKSTLEV